MIDRISSELGDFLRSRRERLEPQALGLARRRRRTPGLRREEVAELAGIGVDWYVRLEQGRAVRPSLATIAGLALALRLDEAERAHLRALARAADRPAFARETVSDALLRLVDNFDQPAYVTGCRWDVLAWNAAAAEIFDFGALPTADRNIVLYVLTHPDARRRFGATWAAEAQRIVAQFRLTNDLWAGDRAFVELLRRVREGCALVAALLGFMDLIQVPAGTYVMRLGIVHMGINLTATTAYVADLMLRLGDPRGGTPPALIVFSAVSFAVLAAGSHLGGSLTYAFGVRVVDESAQRPGYDAIPGGGR